MRGRCTDQGPRSVGQKARGRGLGSEMQRILFTSSSIAGSFVLITEHTCPLYSPVIRELGRDASVESCVRGRIRRGVRVDMIKAGGAESSHGTISHGLAARDRRLIFKV